MASISINEQQVAKMRSLAHSIAENVQQFIQQHSSVSVERAILRLFGVDGVTSEGVPFPNKIVDLVNQASLIENGISRVFAEATLVSGRDVQTTAEMIVNGSYNFRNTNSVNCINDTNQINQIDKKVHSYNISEEALQSKMQELSAQAIAKLDTTRIKKENKQAIYPIPSQPWRYLIVATGNIYEDRIQARSAVMNGADIIAVIRTTAQSLLDYVPYGPTTEGFGGTYATQANFRIMREALDEESSLHNRYIRLVNYSSGLCMSEIAVCAALEDLDMLLNDSMYGILFRDINMKRTFVDQYFSRLICSRSNIIINTGEDNYLTTADAIDSAYTVIASQFINEAMAKKSKLKEELMGLGHAFEINPNVEDALLYEIAHAQLIRQLFPKAPLKYMPPTKYKSTDIFYSNVMDAMFNLTSIATKQGIHLAGILTEANHTPLMMDRYIALKNLNYVFTIAKHLGDEIEFKKDGFISKRANKILNEVECFLEKICKIGLMQSIADGLFADVKRSIDGGKGLDGVFKKSAIYQNPIMNLLES